MEEVTQATPAQIEETFQELAPLNVIRTETVLSQMPIHNLSKKGTVSIHIMRKDSHGKVDLLWKVSPSRDYGEPRQLAYKLDTIVINRRIDEERRPLPPMLRLGSLRELAQELEMGGDTPAVRKALLQNASAFITAKLTYKASDGRVRRLETGFTRYSVVFTGEQLPDGAKADAVFLILNDPYRDVLNNARFRPLDYDYLRQLPPAAQRFYEILSRKIFAALKWKHPTASLTYSEYCTYSAQMRYFERQPVQNQMSSIHREHKKSGYIAGVKYEPTVDAENKPDWVMYYTPGPKAKAEYHAFTRSGRVLEAQPEPMREGEPFSLTPPPRRPGPRQKHLRFAPPPDAPVEAGAPDPVVGELTRRGISEKKALALLAGMQPGSSVIDQLEWGDHLIASQPGRFKNPPGFYIHLLSENVTPPEDFETSRRRQARETARVAESSEQAHRFNVDESYRRYRTAEIDRHIAAHMTMEDVEELIAQKAQQLRKGQWSRNLPAETLRQIAERDARTMIAKEIPILTIEEFSRTYRGGEGEASASPVRTA